MAAVSSLLGASSTSLAFSSKIASSKNGVFASEALAFAPLKGHYVKKGAAAKVVSMAVLPADRAADLGKRRIMNWLLFGTMSLPALGCLGPYLYFFVPPSSVSGGIGLVAKDAVGNDITAKAWLKNHPPGDRTLSQGLKGDPTYLVIESDGNIANYGINAVCTHLGCVVPWNRAENKFICPCHGSQYNNQGKVVRGPAPLSLALARVDVEDDLITFTPWSEPDFRTGENPWWS